MKKIKKIIKIQIPGGSATPQPPLAPILGVEGINIGQFITQFNTQTQKMKGQILPVKVYIYEDRSFSFEIKTPLTSQLIKNYAKIEKGSGVTPVQKVGKITKKDLQEIAKIKMIDLNCDTLEKAMKIVEGTANSMGVEIVD